MHVLLVSAVSRYRVRLLHQRFHVFLEQDSYDIFRIITDELNLKHIR
jgi:hypothetical protein